MPAGDSDSDEDTREYPAFTGPYPSVPDADAPRFVPPPTPAPPAPPAGWPAQQAADSRHAAPYGPGPRSRQRAPEPLFGTSGLASSAGIVLLLFGLVAGLIGGAVLAQRDLLDELVRIARDADVDLNRRALRNLFTSGAWVLLAVGAVHLLSAFGVFFHRQSARFLGILLALLGTAIGAFGVMLALPVAQRGTVEGAALVLAVIATVGYGIALFGLVAGGSHFRRADVATDYRWDRRPAR